MTTLPRSTMEPHQRAEEEAVAFHTVFTKTTEPNFTQFRDFVMTISRCSTSAASPASEGGLSQLSQTFLRAPILLPFPRDCWRGKLVATSFTMRFDVSLILKTSSDKGCSQQGDTAAVCAAAAEVKSVTSLFFFARPNSQLNGTGSKFTAVAQFGPWAPGNMPIAPRPSRGKAQGRSGPKPGLGAYKHQQKPREHWRFLTHKGTAFTNAKRMLTLETRSEN